MVGERRAETDMGTHPGCEPWRGCQYMGAARHPEKQEYPSPAPTVTAPPPLQELCLLSAHTAPQIPPQEGKTGLMSRPQCPGARNRIGNQFAAIRFPRSCSRLILNYPY